MHKYDLSQKKRGEASLGVQWLRIYLAMQEIPLQPLIQEDSIRCRVTKLVCHNYWVHVPQLLKPRHLEPVFHKRSHWKEKGHEAPAGWGLPSQLPGSPPQPHEPLQKRDHRLTPATPAAQGETPVCGQSHPRPSRPGQAFQTTRTTHSQSAEVQGITHCLKSLSLQKTMKSTKGHLRWIFKIILQWRRTSNTEQKSWREKNFSSPKITHTYLAWQKPLSIRLNKKNKWQDRKNMWLLSQTKVGSPTLWRVTMNQ